MSAFSAIKLEQLITELSTRTGRHWSVREIAKATQISSTYITLLKNGQRTNPSMDVVIKLSHFFQVTPEELLELEQLPVLDAAPFVADCTMGSLSTPQMKQTLQLCEQLLASHNPRQALDLLQILMPNASCCPTHELWFDIHLLSFKSMLALGQDDECLTVIERQLADETFLHNQGQLLYIRARLYFQKGLYHTAISDFLRAVTHAEKQEDARLLYLAHYALGICYKESGEYGTSLHHFELANAIAPAELPPVQHAHLQMGVGITHLRMKNMKEALRAFDRAEPLYQAAGEAKFLADLKHNRALASAATGQFAEAIAQLQACLQTHQLVGDHIGIASDFWEIALCYKQLPDWSLAQDYALRAFITFENAMQPGPAGRAKLLLIEAKMNAGEAPAPLLEMIDQVSATFRELAWSLDLAKALRIKAALVRLLGENEQALELSLQAFDLYQTVVAL